MSAREHLEALPPSGASSPHAIASDPTLIPVAAILKTILPNASAPPESPGYVAKSVLAEYDILLIDSEQKTCYLEREIKSGKG